MYYLACLEEVVNVVPPCELKLLVMFIPYSLRAFYRRLSLQRPDSDQIYEAMLQATKDSMRCIRSRKICDLLIALKRIGVGTSDVEFGIKKTCYMLSDWYKLKVKMRIMREKIKDAFGDLKKDEIANAKTWKKCKRSIPPDIRVEYLNRWRQYIRRYKSGWIKKNKSKVRWLRGKWKPKR